MHNGPTNLHPQISCSLQCADVVRREACALPGFHQATACHPEIVPSNQGWLHEIKFDGYRVQGHLVEGKPALITRNGHIWTGRMKSLAAALESLPANNLIVDGEVIVPDGKGASDFDALEVAMGPSGRSADMLFYLFDLLHLDGFDLRAAPPVDHRRIL